MAITVTLPGGFKARIADNAPLSEKRLSGILDDGLTATDRIGRLNDRAFF